MRRVAVLLTAALLPLPAVLAQTAQPQHQHPTGRPGAAGAKAGLQGEAKLRYIVKQLDLDKDQMDYATDLINIYNQRVEEERANGINRLQEVRVLWVQIEDAKKAGDNAKVAELMKQLEDYRTGVVPEREFFESLEGMLTPAQKETLAQVRERLKANPDVQLTPADVLKTARELKLTDEQNKKLTELQEALRTKQQPPAGGEAPSQTKILDDFIKDVRAVLTPEQAAAFDKQIAKMRPDPVAVVAPRAPAMTTDKHAPPPSPAPKTP
jgi:Spy/CpxP family protein refolding chaperone